MTSRKRRLGSKWGCAALILLFVMAPDAGWGQASAPAISPAPLPSAAQEALNKGIIAAKVPDYPLAIRFFEEARKLAPAAPVIFMNLGIAESKMPGRELRAIAWFGAYLAATPDAPNAAAVKEQIAVLDVRNQSNVSRLIKTVQDAGNQIPNNHYLTEVATLWAKSGDINAALNTVKMMEGDVYRGSAQQDIAEIQAQTGDIAGALEIANLIVRPDYKSAALRIVGTLQLASRDIAGAQKILALAEKAAERIEDLQPKAYEMEKIALAQARAGDIAGALKSVTFIQGAYAEPSKSRAHNAIANAQAWTGDIAGAQRSADLIREPKSKSNAQRAVAAAQIKAADIAGAQRTLASAQKTIQSAGDDYFKNIELRAIAGAQIEAGDIAGAQKSADLFKDASWKRGVQEKITEAQAKGVANDPGSKPPATPDVQPAVAPVITASDWLEKLDQDSSSSDCPLNSGLFLDLAGYLKALPPSDTSEKVFASLQKIAEKIVTAQNVVHQLLKQQAAR